MSASRPRSIGLLLALVAALGIVGVAPARAAAPIPVTLTVTPVGTWYETLGGYANRYQIDLFDESGARLDNRGVDRVYINGVYQDSFGITGRVDTTTSRVVPGLNTVAVTFDGGGIYTNVQTTATIDASAATLDPDIAFTLPATAVAGSQLDVPVDVSSAAGPASGQVALLVDGQTVTWATLSLGHAQLSFWNAATGDHRFAVAYLGGGGVAPRTTEPQIVPVAPRTYTVLKQPTVSGPVVEGAQVWVSTVGLFTEDVRFFSWEWLADGVPIPGATYSVLTVPPTAVGKHLSARLTTERDGIEYVPVTLMTAPTEPVRPAGDQVTARAHVQDIGWQPWTTGDGLIGTTGRSLRVEALQVALRSPAYPGDVEVQAHVQDIGWMDPVTAGGAAGTEGRSLRVEAVKMRLTGEMAQHYDLWYRAHVQGYGWLAWTSNGSEAGSAGRSLRVEALEYRLLPKDSPAPPPGTAPSYPYVGWVSDVSGLLLNQAHVQNIGWQPWTSGGSLVGTTGLGLRMEAVRFALTDPSLGNLTAQAHVQNLGWMAPVSDGGIVGTEGQGLRIEAIRLSLPPSLAAQYNVYYRTHVESIGWTAWSMNGRESGSTGLGLRLEALEVRIVDRWDPAPVSESGKGPFYSKAL